ncbi:hypothetical protein BTO06_14835 [Tenacibaculum sp. SZ-18]|uniref:DUF3089 domain-containing protein n=1 Tax=Tenacibaculum sp. SZ-18 TaxID=754423 RepID=UPI000C2CFCCB|nr:DUF3089 domain-containing protein [Tenacibaculum sp. SZ-18]AUC16347.1 hypothetical protein BTO06_14835 [Tenacibaculum sp. SZ-18]
MKIINKLISPKLLFIVCTVVMFYNCKSTYKTQEFLRENIPPKPDYTKEASWAVLPGKYTDSFKKYASNKIDTLKADVFYVYPTLITDKSDTRWNAPIADKKQNEKVLNKAVLMQASAFATCGKVYVPYYRQAHLRSYTLFNKGGKESQELAYSDVRNAFKVYLEKYNNGRPIIMVGHSQGTTHTSRLLEEFFDEKPLQKQLIAAYIPGIRIKSDTYNSIQAMNVANETGGFVSWNTYKKNKYPKKDKNRYKGSLTTNPITWDYSKKTNLNQHKGFLYTNGKIYKKALTIEITDGLVWSTNPKFPFRFFMSFLKNYHAGDINLFWQDIRENAELRTNTYLLKNKGN